MSSSSRAVWRRVQLVLGCTEGRERERTVDLGLVLLGRVGRVCVHR